MTRTRFVLKRLALVPLSALVVVTLSFGLVELIPGDPAQAIAGGFATDEAVDQIRTDLGLDRPLGERYVSYVSAMVTGDLGRSFVTDRPVSTEIVERLPATIELIALALLFAGILGVAMGTAAAYYNKRALGRFTNVGITALQSIPDFLLALLLIYFLFFIAGVAPPPVGRTGLSGGSVETVTGFLLVDSLLAGDIRAFGAALQHLMLPVLSLGFVYSAYLGKTARSTMTNALRSEQVEFARACGLHERTVLRYALVQARTPIITYLAILFGALLGGAAIVETIFSWQGVGQWSLKAMLDLDVPAIQGFIAVAGLVTVVLYLLLDIIVMWLDPRITY